MAYTLITSQVLGSSAASVTFSSIPSTYKDLVLQCSVRSDRVNSQSQIQFRFNNDSSTLYSTTYINGDGVNTPGTSGSTNATWLNNPWAGDGANATANTFGSTELYLPNYTSTSSKPSSFYGNQESNSTGATMLITAGLYRNTSAINQITIYPFGSTNWVTNSSFYLYGIN
jgi:hypothetical protein